MKGKEPMDKPPESPFPDYEYVPNGKDVVFPDGTVEKGYELRKKEKKDG
jgi:hypothetical protein